MLENMMMTMEECTMMMLLGPVPVASLQAENNIYEEYNVDKNDKVDEYDNDFGEVHTDDDLQDFQASSSS